MSEEVTPVKDVFHNGWGCVRILSEPNIRKAPGQQNSQTSTLSMVSLTSASESESEPPPPHGAQEPTRPTPENQDSPPLSEATYTWGTHDPAGFSSSLDEAYEEAVHWRPNLFKLPYGKAGKSFTSELARLYSAFASGSALESIALKATVVLPILMLQKPSAKSKLKDHIACLDRRLITWQTGYLQDLILEGRTIQRRIPKPTRGIRNQENIARSFAKI